MGVDPLAGAGPSKMALDSTSRAVVERAMSAIPSRTPQEVGAHCTWYCAHLVRLAQKKLLVDQWRRERQQANDQLPQVVI